MSNSSDALKQIVGGHKVIFFSKFLSNEHLCTRIRPELCLQGLLKTDLPIMLKKNEPEMIFWHLVYQAKVTQFHAPRDAPYGLHVDLRNGQMSFRHL